MFLAPSISLVAQTLREWTAEARDPIHALVVCSDSKVGRDEEDLRIQDLAYPATTDSAKLASAAENLSDKRRIVVFSTYQSIQVVSEAQSAGLGNFDLIICDEAHRTTGLTLSDKDSSDFLKVHCNNIIRGTKRLYMTATPRIYAEASKAKAHESKASLYSMDEEEKFGSEFYRLGFGKAVERNLLSEYKVLIVAVEQDKMGAIANDYNNTYRLDDKKAIDINFATKIVGSWKGLSKMSLVVVDEDGEQEALKEDTEPMRRAVAFSRSIKASEQMTEAFGKLVDRYNEVHEIDDASDMVHCHLKHVDGTMNALQRFSSLGWLKDNPGAGNCRILSNARCLSEGIDVPALDSVVFFDTRDSIVDIVQSVGRVMRKAEGKKYGYIILPVCIPSMKIADYNNYIENDPQFRSIWKVIKALRAHDESLVDEAEFRRKIQVISGGGDPGKGEGNGGGNLPLDIPVLPIGDISEAVYAAIPKKLGDREYWSEWAKSIGGVAKRLIARIDAMIDDNPEVAKEFAKFVKGLQNTLNPSVSEEDAVEMLAQHILTMPVFQSLFSSSNFPEHNVVGQALEAVIRKLDASSVSSETTGLQRFYDRVHERISLAKSDKSKQDIIRNLYDTFFKNAFPRIATRLGIVYTPVPVVDFILSSADSALRNHFGKSLSSKGVQILDPFAGTGTFFVRLIQSGLVSSEALKRKYGGELHANELVLLAYYIATVNIESAYHGAVGGSYRSFDGMILTDTFQMNEDKDMMDKIVLPENNKRARRQLSQPIQVIIGNPPYKAQQASQNDNNRNLSYPTLDERIRETYAKKSSSGNKKNLYDSYIRAIRWASDRIGDRGIVSYVTNGSFLEANNMDGLRLSLAEEFSHIYIFNLRGNQRTSGEKSRREGGKIFGSGSRTPVAVTIMVKESSHASPCKLYYHDIGDCLSREEKLSIIDDFSCLNAVPWRCLHPNAEGDWINQRDPAFDSFVPMTSKDKSEACIFDLATSGVTTARDAWVSNASSEVLTTNICRMINEYDTNRDRYRVACVGKTKSEWPEVEKIIDNDPRKISWSRSLKKDIVRDRNYALDKKAIVKSLYRPFASQWLYFSRNFIEYVYQQPRLFPTSKHDNYQITIPVVGTNNPFSALVTNAIPDYGMAGHCFPLYCYEHSKHSSNRKKTTAEMFDDAAHVDSEGFVRRDAISDWALTLFRNSYEDNRITKEDIFWYIYGIFHSPEYKDRFASDLRKMTPRIPIASNFRAFGTAGRELGQWHLNYEKVEPYPLEEDWSRLAMEDPDYRVDKMVFGKHGGKKDKSIIIYNQHLNLKGIPLEVYSYEVNGKSALEWVMERYAVSIHKASQIKNDPNDWSDDPRYIIELVKRVVRVSIETVRIVSALPPLNERDSQ